MAWVVDTSLILDIGLDDPKFAVGSERLLLAKLSEKLVICPVTFIELAPAFAGNQEVEEEFLFHLGIASDESWTPKDTAGSAAAWAEHIGKRRKQGGSKRPVADVLIGAFAQRFQGLLTRNASDFRKLFPQLPLIEPEGF